MGPITEERRTTTEATADFESAQRHLFEAVGLDTRSQFVDLTTPRTRTHVFETGPPGGDLPLVFVHGTGAFGAFFAPLAAQFDGVRTIAFDRPGYGLSDPFTYTEGNIRRTVVDVLDGVLDELGLEQVDLVGHSMGGHASIRFALAHPDRVRRLILVGAVPAFPGTQPPVPIRLLTVPLLNRLLRRLQKPGEEGVLDIAEIFGERDSIQRYPALIRAMAANERNPESARAGLSEFRSLLWLGGWRSSVQLRQAELRNIQHRTMFIWGDHDPLGGPADVHTAVRSIPDVQFETVDAGHVPYWEHPERCAQLIRKMRE